MGSTFDIHSSIYPGSAESGSSPPLPPPPSNLSTQRMQHNVPFANVKQENEPLYVPPKSSEPSAAAISSESLEGESPGQMRSLDGLTPRSYLDSTVVPVLLDGMKLVVTERPADPLTFLGRYLLMRAGNANDDPTNQA
ncbi:hypothetical protein DFQ30_010773 [Apophysomyces sp. BC1015]|nr:hypothetical protein DFQ30_010773 [Apophysomyces sp. BC1015]